MMNKKRLKLYFRIWLRMSKNSLNTWLFNKSAIVIFLLGKLIRYIFYFSFLYYLVRSTNGLLGYTVSQTLFFTATYLLIDTFSQFLFRNVYTFRQLIVTGDFDYLLLKPINPLFRSLMNGPDPIDFITIPPILVVVIYFGLQVNPSFESFVFYLILVLNGLFISMSFHIIVLSIGVITTEIENTIMVYRDLSSMARLPIDIYAEPLKSILTYVLPIGIIFTLPAKALMGIVSPLGVLLSLLFGIFLFFVSVQFWKYALKKYTSASS